MIRVTLIRENGTTVDTDCWNGGLTDEETLAGAKYQALRMADAWGAYSPIVRVFFSDGNRIVGEQRIEQLREELADQRIPA